MNCKPGDLAVVVGASKYAGKLVEVLYAQPPERFRLPDGYEHAGAIEEGATEQGWVLRILGEPVEAPLCDAYGRPTGTFRLARYLCVRDSKLRPLRGEPEREEHDEEITA